MNKMYHTACTKCFAYNECGGWANLPEEISLISCFEAFGHKNGHFTHTSRPAEMARRLGEVRFHQEIHPSPFATAELNCLPEYLPLIQGGISFKRSLNLDFAALNLIENFHGDRRLRMRFGERPLTAISIRQDWGLKPEAKILLSGVANDPALERLWANFRVRDIAQKVASLNIHAVTAPNFTFWKNAPRIENLINRRRMFSIAEDFSSVGIPVIPHINSNHIHDWVWMKDFFIAHPELNAVCMEFRTGNRKKEVLIRKINHLRDLRNDIGRDLHIITIGNSVAAKEAKKYFSNVTAVDSTPTLKTINRQKAVNGNKPQLKWRKEPFSSDECMADYFEENLRAHRQWLMSQMHRQDSPDCNEKPAKRLRKPSQGTMPYIQNELPLDAA